MTTLSIVASILGWVAFAAWSISFYPQVLLNYRRKSVVGLSLDYMAYNITGFLFYSIYCVSKFIFQHDHPELSKSVDPNDIAFAVHALVLVIVQVSQCFIYERRGQTVHKLHAYICSILWVLVIYNCFLAGFGFLSWLPSTSKMCGNQQSFNVIEFLGYCKSFISFIKYIPQAYLNFSRQSTAGWSIENVWLDLIGGLCTFAQQLLDAINSSDWTVFTSNVPKVLLAVESVAFDLIFLVQHYILYRNREEPINNSDSDQYGVLIDPSSEKRAMV